MKILLLLTPSERQAYFCSFPDCKEAPLYLTEELGFCCVAHFKIAEAFENGTLQTVTPITERGRKALEDLLAKKKEGGT